jgi:O-acetyl-ADP-ribose deacetylase (regulator of RNase III)
MMHPLEISQENITYLHIDAIVNAANKSLLGGGGVDGAIHRAAGPQLLQACRKLDGCETGEAKITKGYRLPAKWIIHTVGPVWQGGGNNEEENLANCYKNSLKLAMKNNCKTIAFPNISTGVYRFPKALAAEIAIKSVYSFISANNYFEKIKFVCFDDENFKLYMQMVNS